MTKHLTAKSIKPSKAVKEIWVDRVIAFLGVGLAVYFYFHPYPTRCLTYQIHPVRSPLIVESRTNSADGQAEALAASFQGKPVAGPVYSALIAVWNAGNQAIRHGDILEPLTIRTGGTPILEARMLYATRRVVNWRLAGADGVQGLVTADWDILEKDDGGIVQVVYAGGPETPIIVSAVMESQREITPGGEARYFLTRQKNFLRGWLGLRLAGWVFLALGLAGIYLGLMGLLRNKGQAYPQGMVSRVLSTFAIMVNLLLFSLGFYLVLLLQDTRVPFPF
jgi:hypothetical protein